MACIHGLFPACRITATSLYSSNTRKAPPRVIAETCPRLAGGYFNRLAPSQKQPGSMNRDARRVFSFLGGWLYASGPRPSYLSTKILRWVAVMAYFIGCYGCPPPARGNKVVCVSAGPRDGHTARQKLRFEPLTSCPWHIYSSPTQKIRA